MNWSGMTIGKRISLGFGSIILVMVAGLVVISLIIGHVRSQIGNYWPCSFPDRDGQKGKH